MSPLLRLKTTSSSTASGSTTWSTYDSFSGRYVQQFVGHPKSAAVYAALCTPDARCGASTHDHCSYIEHHNSSVALRSAAARKSVIYTHESHTNRILLIWHPSF